MYCSAERVWTLMNQAKHNKAQNPMAYQPKLRLNISTPCCIVFKLEQDQKLNTFPLVLQVVFCLGATMKHWPDNISGRTSAFLLMFWDSVPREHQSPIKSANLRFSRVSQELEGVPVNDVNYWTHHSWRLVLNSTRFKDKKGDTY